MLRRELLPAGCAASVVNHRQSFPFFCSSSVGLGLASESTILGDIGRLSRPGRLRHLHPPCSWRSQSTAQLAHAQAYRPMAYDPTKGSRTTDITKNSEKGDQGTLRTQASQDDMYCVQRRRSNQPSTRTAGGRNAMNLLVQCIPPWRCFVVTY